MPGAWSRGACQLAIIRCSLKTLIEPDSPELTVSLTSDVTDLTNQITAAEASLTDLHARLQAAEAAVAAATSHASLWDTVEAEAGHLADGVADSVRNGLMAAVADARALLNL